MGVSSRGFCAEDAGSTPGPVPKHLLEEAGALQHPRAQGSITEQWQAGQPRDGWEQPQASPDTLPPGWSGPIRTAALQGVSLGQYLLVATLQDQERSATQPPNRGPEQSPAGGNN